MTEEGMLPRSDVPKAPDERVVTRDERRARFELRPPAEHIEKMWHWVQRHVHGEVWAPEPALWELPGLWAISTLPSLMRISPTDALRRGYRYLGPAEWAASTEAEIVQLRAKLVGYQEAIDRLAQVNDVLFQSYLSRIGELEAEIAPLRKRVAERDASLLRAAGRT
jgi:hypothetical protein